jgi:hypothetical protein
MAHTQLSEAFYLLQTAVDNRSGTDLESVANDAMNILSPEWCYSFNGAMHPP